MRIRTFDELPASAELGRALLHDGAFGSSFPAAAVAAWRSRSDALAEYVGLFAVDSGEVVGQCYVRRIPYAFPSGEGTVAGIAAVGTRPDRGGRGIARALLTDVARREREADIGHLALWTNRSWGAHRLYERLGYRDLHQPPTALRRPPRGPARPLPASIRPATMEDLPGVEALHDRLAEGRLGFARRARNALRVAAATGEVDPAKEILLARGHDGIEGYAFLRMGSTLLHCGELLATRPAVAARLQRAVERLTARRPIAFGFSVVGDRPNAFPADRYARLDSSWYVLMGARPGRSRSGAELRTEFATEDPRFLCFAGDRF